MNILDVVDLERDIFEPLEWSTIDLCHEIGVSAGTFGHAKNRGTPLKRRTERAIAKVLVAVKAFQALSEEARAEATLDYYMRAQRYPKHAFVRAVRAQGGRV